MKHLLLLALFATAALAQPPAPEEEWQGAKPEHAEPANQIEPPRGSFGFKGCGHYAIWVFLANGKSYRVDSEHAPKSPDDMKKLLDWLNDGPTDIVEFKECGTAT